jgi:3-hydroxymyristoyl/3-hydroxydecanoyl-(acyl carrier protein) dehydratase
VRYVLIDRITALEPRQTLAAIKNVSLSDDLVTRVRPGVSALPGSMVLEAMAQAAGLLVVASVDEPAQPVLAKVQPFTAYRDAVVGDRIELRAELQDLRREGARTHVIAAVDDSTIAEAVIYLGLMPIGGDERLALMRERLADAFPGWFDEVVGESEGRSPSVS